MNKIEKLIEIGFLEVGTWMKSKKNEGRIEFQINQNMDNQDLLYAFESDNIVYYIGKTDKSLKERMNNYKSGKLETAGSTNKYVHDKILDLLGKNRKVNIYILIDNINMDYKGIKISLASGIELNLIRSFDTEKLWNSRGAISNRSPRNQKINSNDIEKKENNEKIFELKLGKEYYNKGVISIPISYKHLVPISGGILVKIYFDYNRSIFSNFTRSGNNLKIYGGDILKDWFQKNHSLNDRVRIQIISEKEFKII
jgi:hypothetical protein